MDVGPRSTTCTPRASPTPRSASSGFCMGGRVTFLVGAGARARRGGRVLRGRHRRAVGFPQFPPLIERAEELEHAVARPLRRPRRLHPGRRRRDAARRASPSSTCRPRCVRYADRRARLPLRRAPQLQRRGGRPTPGSRTLGVVRRSTWPDGQGPRRPRRHAHRTGSGEQHVFFVAAAPSERRPREPVAQGPRQPAGARARPTVAYLDLTGSGAETIAHTRENGRITLMFCAFDRAALILRLFGDGVGPSCRARHASASWRRGSRAFPALARSSPSPSTGCRPRAATRSRSSTTARSGPRCSSGRSRKGDDGLRGVLDGDATPRASTASPPSITEACGTASGNVRPHAPPSRFDRARARMAGARRRRAARCRWAPTCRT